MIKRNIRLTIEYDGSDFFGWQIQKNQKTIQGEIRKAVEDGDARITDLHIWRVGPGKFATIVALVAERPLPPDDYARRVRVHDELVHVTIEPHPA